MLLVLTNEDQTTLKRILLEYVKNIDTSSKIATRSSTSNATTYWIGNPGKYFVKGLMNDTMNNSIIYLFTTDKNLASGTFGVFKMDFTPTSLKYVYTALSMSSGSSFSVNCIIRTS